MWSAIKSDLFEFVNTIQQDTSTTLNKVLGEEEEEELQEEQEVVLEKLRVSVRRTYETYANPLKENRQREFERYRKKFSLSAHTKEIANALDEEPEISRFYAELVPLCVSPEEFWARLFFRLQLLQRSGTAQFEDEDDEEEELVWEEDDLPAVAQEERETDKHSQALEEERKKNTQLQAHAKELEQENAKLKGQLKALLLRVSQLEDELSKSKSKKDSAPSSPQRLPPSLIEENRPEKEGDALSSSSEGSGLLVTHSDTERESDGSRAKEQHSAAPATNPSVSSSAAYLASLEDDEEEGWN